MCCLFGGVWWYACSLVKWCWWNACLCVNACCIYSVKPTWRHGTASALTSLISILPRGEGHLRRAESVLQNCVMGRCAICIFMYCYSSDATFWSIWIQIDYGQSIHEIQVHEVNARTPVLYSLTINDTCVQGLYNTGASISIMSKKFYNQIHHRQN